MTSEIISTRDFRPNSLIENPQLRLLLITLILFCNTSLHAQDEITQIVIGERIVHNSTVMNEEVLLEIHLPKNYSEETEYPVMYLLDGEYFFSQVTSIVDYLSDNPYVRKELIPKFIVVGVSTQDRNKYFTPTVQSDRFPTSGSAELFVKFLQHELFPYVESHYSTKSQRLVTGWSLGGLFTTYCYLNHPGMFDYYLAVSPSLWWDDMLLTKQLEDVIAKGTLSPKPLTITIGELEKGSMPNSIKGSFLPVITKAAHPQSFSFVEIKDESHDFTPMLAFYKGLQSLYYNWSIPESLLTENKLDELEKVIFEYANQFGHNGDDIKAAGYFLIDIGKQQINYEASIIVGKFLTLKFPESSYAQYTVGEFCYRNGDLDNALEYIKTAAEIEEAKPEPNAEILEMYKGTYEVISKE